MDYGFASLRLGPWAAFPGPHYGGRTPEKFSRISGAKKGNGLRDSSRATGPWPCKNCRWCGSICAPGFAELTAAVRILRLLDLPPGGKVAGRQARRMRGQISDLL